MNPIDYLKILDLITKIKTPEEAHKFNQTLAKLPDSDEKKDLQRYFTQISVNLK